MRKIRDLQTDELRVLGALLEKEQATPDHYPLTLNALVAACNQKSNRNPVTRMTAEEVGESLEALRRDVLVWRNEGGRSVHWSQSISRRLELDEEEKAVLTLLLLRGPQTVGELRGRSARLHSWAERESLDTHPGRHGRRAASAGVAVSRRRTRGRRHSRKPCGASGAHSRGPRSDRGETAADSLRNRRRLILGGKAVSLGF